MFKPLNPTLYALLESRFGRVKVAHPGGAHRSRVVVDPLSGRNRLRRESAGEEYRVCCPVCGDSKFRLHVNHTFGVRDPLGGYSETLLHCFNEDCMRSRENLRDFLEDLGTPGVLSLATVRKGEDRPPPPAELPDGFVPLDRLPPDDPCVAYVRSRGFDPGRLARAYGVGAAPVSVNRLAEGRVVVPVYRRGALAGWQARYPADLDWKAAGFPKYFFMEGFSRDRAVYNLDGAAGYRTLVLCEGVTDVWRFGPMACATFGCSVTEEQERQVARAAAGGATVVVLQDADRAGDSKAEELARRLAGRVGRGRVALARPPEGMDPADMTREAVRRLAAESAAAQGVPVSFERREAPPLGGEEGGEGGEGDHPPGPVHDAAPRRRSVRPRPRAGRRGVEGGEGPREGVVEDRHEGDGG